MPMTRNCNCFDVLPEEVLASGGDEDGVRVAGVSAGLYFDTSVFGGEAGDARLHKSLSQSPFSMLARKDDKI